jgi:hypothetical protein
MVTNYKDLEFNHFVVATADGTIFGSARENGNGHTYNFLIQGDCVRIQRGEQWYALELAIAEIIRARAQAAYASVPIYRTSRLLTN